MSNQLLPYGSLSHASQIAKVASPIKVDFFQPYGSSRHAGSVTKVAVGAPTPPKTPKQGIKRLNKKR